jgi:phage replication initiation protein
MAKSPLVLVGSEVKLRLLAERQSTKSVVHLDWVRFTVIRRNAPAASADNLFPKKRPMSTSIWDEANRDEQFRKILAELPDADFHASVQAHELAIAAAACMGSAFQVSNEAKKGIDFYKFRWSIELNGQECGWVGFLASSESPRQQSQAKTIHVNLFGTACTFADTGWNHRLADLADSYDADITRCDLALDFFDGIPGGIESIREDYRAGLCNVGGRKLKFNMVGDWENGHDRSLYIGSREAGKITNVYEKGDQLFGEKSNSEWLRAELRYGNKLRVLSTEMLRRPADFFAGASDWHQSLIYRALALEVVAEPVKCTPRLQVQTVQAECVRSLRWLKNTAAASMALAFEYLGVDEFTAIVSGQKLPGRLSKFSREQIKAQLTPAFEMTSIFTLTKCEGTHATFTVESSPAFA